jgi:benzoate 4-monooxygenase
VPAVKILNGRGEYSMSMGSLPPSWRPFVKQLPGYRQGGKDVKSLAGIAIMAVAKRLATPTDRTDLLSKLQAGKDENVCGLNLALDSSKLNFFSLSQGDPMGREELTAEALTLLIAGSDTTSK